MPGDIRISITLPRHRKYLRLKRLIGRSPMEYLVTFWISVAEQAPNGSLERWSNEDIEDAAGWDGDQGVLVEGLIQAGFLDKAENGFTPHDWAEHQPWVVGAKERSAAARLAGKASAEARKDKYGTAQPPNHARTDRSEAVPTFDRTPPEPDSNPRTPSPSPSPKSKEYTSAYADVCPEPKNPPAPDPPQQAPHSPIFLEFPIKADKKAGNGKPTTKTHLVTEQDVSEWEELFPGLDVRTSLRSCLAWNAANPEKRKTARGIKKHITGWLIRDNDSGKHIRASPSAAGDTMSFTEEDFAKWKAQQREVPHGS